LIAARRIAGLTLVAAAGLWLSHAALARQSTAAPPAKPPAKQAPASPANNGTPAGGASGQKDAAGSAAAPAAAPAGAGGAADGSTLGGAPPPDMGNIDQILEGDEEVLQGNSFTYDPGNRRDPFKSLLIAPDRPEFRGPRPEGIPGLLIDEIDLKGIFRTARGFVAQVTASNQKKGHLLKVGDQLYDGDVVSITKNEVVFKQIVQDPTALKPFREVVKTLGPQ
jgi:Tfp pilus assembly protein PilP